MIWGLAAIVLALPGAVAALHLLTLSLASLSWRPDAPTGGGPRLRFLVLIPARDEEACITATLASVGRVLRPGDQVLVVADHCSDRTAELAREAGARVLERDAGEASRAAARQDGLRSAAGLVWDAVAFVDADSQVGAGYLDACERALADADVAQARAEAVPSPGVLGHAATTAAALQGVILPRGRDRCGLMVGLRGSGLVLRRGVTDRFRFHAPVSEDGVLAAELCLAGYRARHVDDARIRPLSATSLTAASGQRMRWEAGRLTNARRFVVALLRARTAASIEMAIYLASPPFAVAVALLVTGTAVAWLGGAPAVAGGLLLLLGSLGVVLVVGLLTVRAPLATWMSLLAAPWYVLWKAGIQVRALLRVARGGHTEYPPTPRT